MKDAVYVNKKDSFCGYQEILKQVVNTLMALRSKTS